MCSKLGRVLSSINKLRPSNKHIVIGCTVLPGYCQTVGSFLLEDCVNTTLSYNPEFIQQGDIIRGFLNPDMVLIGEGSEDAGDLLQGMYEAVCENSPVICRMSSASAEVCKLSINCFITTKISFANMIGDIADRTPGANKDDILRAVGSDSRVGLKCLKPGYGFGGPCFPRDNRALGGYASSIGVKPLVSIATDEYNEYHAHVMADAMESAKESPEATFTFTDVAYKPNCAVAIIEESQKLKVAGILAKRGHQVVIKDREFIIELVRAEFGRLFGYEIGKQA